VVLAGPVALGELALGELALEGPTGPEGVLPGVAAAPLVLLVGFGVEPLVDAVFLVILGRITLKKTIISIRTITAPII
jgi:hypothetical protein